ncbi:heavy-metal-associated domain-containing protein [Meiothermus granaticius]|uniref:Mercuric transport protein periplasmic component n=1 Tax=Meiothermus granaticius NBRC 107808 TaxID=1227551 RepID=A0A399FDH2_9DEIN|nr:heavy-metal-associated domain-containing protein [Thermaceae bacterium]RIH93479.1 mercuric transport protein periplasmic component [Meiothermus granaticius NBRC 107808]GEM85974.1 hypothetical protein MGR01S_05990 [Meiothermus granaticius NBRC 107808]
MENVSHQNKLKVPGMHCAGCIRMAEAALRRIPGTQRVRVDYLRKEATVVSEAPLSVSICKTRLGTQGIAPPATSLG